MGEVIADLKGKGFIRGLVPGVWGLTGEVTNNLFDRVSFTTRVLAEATIAKVEDMIDSVKPMSVQEILSSDARKHIGSMALEKGLNVPEDFVKSAQQINLSRDKELGLNHIL